ncbi:MAG TPA: hypothetical protein P5526_31575 [Anaerolineae bacterium]|nr:hypothetical protein [Anaerolineae bacterium]
MNTLPPYKFGAARTMVYLHGQYLQAFLAVWQQAQAAGLALPETDDPSYVSLETLLHHVMGAARRYMVWMCSQLDLPDPAIKPAPPPEVIEGEAGGYLAHLIERWELPLAEVEEERFARPEYPSNWGTRYCVEAMLEHAVMHAILHRVQLEELLAEQRPD